MVVSIWSSTYGKSLGLSLGLCYYRVGIGWISITATPLLPIFSNLQMLGISTDLSLCPHNSHLLAHISSNPCSQWLPIRHPVLTKPQEFLVHFRCQTLCEELSLRISAVARHNSGYQHLLHYYWTHTMFHHSYYAANLYSTAIRSGCYRYSWKYTRIWQCFYPK